MATSIEQILGKDINSLKELREEIKRLQDSIANVDPATQEFKDTTEKLIAAQTQLTSVTRATKDENVAATDSIVGMEKEYKNLYNTYKMLTEEQRNSPMGKEMEVQLKSLSERLNETKKAVGNYKDNIGHYAESITEAFSKMGISLGGLSAPLKLATGGVNGLNTALKANPLLMVIGLVKVFIGIVNKMKDAIAGNEELQNRWNMAMTAFKPIADAAKNTVDALATGFVGLMEGIANATRWLRQAIAAVTDFLGLTDGENERLKNQNDTYKAIEKSQQALTKAKREYQKLNAKDQAEVERLREEASETDDMAKKQELLNQAKELQGQIDARNIELAKEELRILQEQARLTPNSAADNERLAQAEAAVAQAEAQAARNARTLNKAINATKSAANGAKKSLNDLRKEAEELFNQTVDNTKSELEKLDEKYQKELKLLQKYNKDATLLTKQYERERTRIIEQNSRTLAQNAAEAYDMFEEGLGSEKRYQNAIEEFGLYDRLFERWKQLFKNWDYTTEQIQQAKDLIEEMNAAAGTNFVFPEEVTKKRIDELYVTVSGHMEGLSQKVQKAFTEWLMYTFRDSNIYDDIFKNIEKRLREQNLGNELTTLLLGSSQHAFEMMKAADEADATETRLAKYEQIYNAANKAVQDASQELQRFMEIRQADNEELQRLYEELQNADEDHREAAQQAYDNWSRTLMESEEMDENRLNLLIAQEQAAKDARLQVWTEYYGELEKKRKAEWAAQELEAQRWEEVWQTTVDSVLDGFDSVASVLESIAKQKENQIALDQESGKITATEAKRQTKALEAYQKAILALNIVSIVGSTAAGIMDLWKAYAAEQVANAETAAATGPAAAATLAALNAASLTKAIVGTAGLAAQGIAQLAALNSGSISSAGGNGMDNSGTAAVPSTIESNPYTYTRNLQTAEEEDALNTKTMFVSVQDINAAQAQVKVTDRESTF